MAIINHISQTGIKPLVLEEICSLAKKYNMDKVILFGSRARGDYSRASDIDLAVIGGNVVDFTLGVNDETSTLLSFDVVDLNKSVDERLLKDIGKDGITIYEKI